MTTIDPQLRKQLEIESLLVAEFSQMALSMVTAEEYSGLKRVLESLVGHATKLPSIVRAIDLEAPTEAVKKVVKGPKDV